MQSVKIVLGFMAIFSLGLIFDHYFMPKQKFMKDTATSRINTLFIYEHTYSLLKQHHHQTLFKLKPGSVNMDLSENLIHNSSNALNLHQWIPMTTQLCLCIEIALKLIIKEQNGIDKRGHYLHELFLELNMESQEQIIESMSVMHMVDNKLSKDKKELFLDVLKSHNNDFVDMRYLYEEYKGDEDNKEIHTYFLEDLLQKLKEHIYIKYFQKQDEQKE